MLVLGRRINEGVVVDGPCRISVVSTKRGYVHLGFEADPSVRILRDELLPEKDDDPHATEGEDICGFCGEPGADKIPHPVRWPGEQSAGTELVHADCEQEETRRAHAALSDSERAAFLRTI